MRDNCDKPLTFKVKNLELLHSFFLFLRWETSGGVPKRPRSRIWRYELMGFVLHLIINISYEYKVLSSSAYPGPDHGGSMNIKNAQSPPPPDTSSSPSVRIPRCSKARRETWSLQCALGLLGSPPCVNLYRWVWPLWLKMRAL